MQHISVGAERRTEWNGGLYIIRDVWEMTPGPEGFKGRLERCEYAVKNDEGHTIWKPCIEGVLFADIEPFEKVAA